MSARDGGYDDWLDAVAESAGTHLECANGHGWLPRDGSVPTAGHAIWSRNRCQTRAR